MTDAHCHVTGDADRYLICSPSPLIDTLASSSLPTDSRLFFGIHPWEAESFDATELRRRLAAEPLAGVGEIGLDRLKEREISESMRSAFASQLEIAAEFSRPAVLHGAKCWGEVVKAVRPYAGRIPAFLFHGFSRSDGLLPDIVAINGFISVGPAILNDHAVNYRRLAAKIPDGILLIETDRTPENAAASPKMHEIAAQLAKIRGISIESLEAITERTADRFVEAISGRQ